MTGREIAASRAGATSFATAHVMSMDPAVGNFVRGDVLIEGKKILAVGPNLRAGGAAEIDARGRIVMPGFVDTHHHQAWTAIRSSIPDSILIDDGTGTPSAQQNYFGNVLVTAFAPAYRPQDVYISELFGGLLAARRRRDDGARHLADPSLAAALRRGRQGADGYRTARRARLSSKAPATLAGNQYPNDAVRIKQRWFSSDRPAHHHDHGRRGLSRRADLHAAWTIGRQLGLQVAAHILSPFGMRPILDDLAAGTGGAGNNIGLGPDNLFVHMTGMSDFGWQAVKDKGVQVSIAFPIEMNMRHGIPPILKMQQLGIEPSLSSDVETNMTADFFTQMRSAMTMQRMVVNQIVLDSGLPIPVNPWPPFPAGTPPLLNVRDVLRFATINGAKHLRLDGKTGSLTPGKEADIILLDATTSTCADQPRAGRGRVAHGAHQRRDRDRRGQGAQVEGPAARRRSAPAAPQLEASRDYIFTAAGVPQNLFP